LHNPSSSSLSSFIPKINDGIDNTDLILL
jgi:hypothetical protein